MLVSDEIRLMKRQIGKEDASNARGLFFIRPLYASAIRYCIPVLQLLRHSSVLSSVQRPRHPIV